MSNQSYARNQLAITPDMKADLGYVIDVVTTKPISAHAGIVGAQGAALGGGNQVHFVLPPNERGSVFKVVGERTLD